MNIRILIIKLKLLLLPSKLKPDFVLESVRDINEDFIKELKKLDINSLILDVDDTLRTDLRDISLQNKKWLEWIKDHLNIIVVSNGYDLSLKEYFKSLGIEYMYRTNKPLKKYFMIAKEKLAVNSENILVIGDSLLDDIIGGKISSMYTALVKWI